MFRGADRTLATKRHKKHKRIANRQLPIADLKNGEEAQENWQLAIGNRKYLKDKLGPELNITRVVALRGHQAESCVWGCRRPRIQAHACSKVRMIERI
jgi:hypothetical protein